MLKVGHDGCGREVPPDFQRLLDDYNRYNRFPIRLIWNPKGRCIQRGGWKMWTGHELTRIDSKYEPRWEVWVKWDETTHPYANGKRKDDVRLVDGELLIRVSPYETSKGDYADPFDGRFWRALAFADSWNRRTTRHSGVDAHFNDIPDDSLKKAGLVKEITEMVLARKRYYSGLDNTSVGHYVSSGWRHRLPHR